MNNSKTVEMSDRLYNLAIISLKIFLIACVCIIAAKHGYSAEDHFAPGKDEVTTNMGSGSTVQWLEMAAAGGYAVYKTFGEWTIKQGAGYFMCLIMIIYGFNAVIY